MTIEFILSYIWCPKNAAQVGPRSAEEKANYEVVGIGLFL